MLSTTALVSLSCLLSSGEVDPNAMAKLTENLSQHEVAIIQEIQQRGTCLPEKFSELVNKQALGGPSTSPTSDFAASRGGTSPTSDF